MLTRSKARASSSLSRHLKLESTQHSAIKKPQVEQQIQLDEQSLPKTTKRKISIRSINSLPFPDYIPSVEQILPLPRALTSREIREKCRITPAESSQEFPAPVFQVPNELKGNLQPALVISRPSKIIRTPYVADILLSSEDGSSKVVQAHVPSLDTGGLVVPGATVYVSSNQKEDSGNSEGKNRRTTHTIWFCTEARRVDESSNRISSLAMENALDSNYEWTFIGCHPSSTEHALSQILHQRLLGEIFGDYSEVVSQVTVNNSRFDFALTDDNGSVKWLIETKVVVCANYPRGKVPPDPLRHPVGVYQSDEKPYLRTSIFPHGAKKPKIQVVSERAIKHVHELSSLKDAVRDKCIESKAGRISQETRTAVVFVVSREDCVKFHPCYEADPLFSRVLFKAAQNSQVKVMAIRLVWCVNSGRCWLARNLVEIDWGKEVLNSLDGEEEWLQEVLEAAAEGTYSRGKSAGNLKRRR